MSYPIVETFHSLQGEGYWSGCSAFFIRLAGCDVGCSWCDTKPSWSLKPHPQVALHELVRQAQRANPQFVVITGGEPLMHDLSALTHALKGAGLPLHLETSGAHPLTGTWDWITLSPKPYKPPHPPIYCLAHELKVVVSTPADLEWAEQQAKLVDDRLPKFLQPEWYSKQSHQLVTEYIKTHPQWRLSLQIHKFLQIR
ncbi:MAG: 7-carboxy-7-deazaguanine synthase QueE [Pseudanabaenaceae cyanobacterium]